VDGEEDMMRVILILAWLVTAFMGFGTLAMGQTSIHEIAGYVLLLISALLFCAYGIIDAILFASAAIITAIENKPATASAKASSVEYAQSPAGRLVQTD